MNTIEYNKPDPPKIKRPIGHPKKQRRKESTEEVPGNSHKLKRTYEVTCYKCGQVGHYPKTCKGPFIPNAKPRWLNRKKASDATSEVSGTR